MLLRLKCALVAATTIAFASAPALSQNFTYQGQLKNTGLPANGNFDMQFGVYPLPLGGLQI
jgi:hypothetical protein